MTTSLLSPEQRAARVRLMLFDVDGVLTDGRLFFDAQGEALKIFHAHDGHGLKMLREAGIRVGILSGRDSPAARARAQELRLDVAYWGVTDKLAALSAIAQQTGCAEPDIGFMGDDWVDLAVMRRVGFAASVPNAASRVSRYAHWCARLPGGQGAVRELAEYLLAAHGKLEALFAQHLAAGAAQG